MTKAENLLSDSIIEKIALRYNYLPAARMRGIYCGHIALDDQFLSIGNDRISLYSTEYSLSQKVFSIRKCN